MAIVVNNVNDLKQYPTGDISKLDAYIFGTMITKSDGTGSTYEEARSKARASACKEAANKTRTKRYPFVINQDQFPQNPGATSISLESVVENGGIWTATTNDIELSMVGYKRFHGPLGMINGPAIVNEFSQIPGLQLKREDPIFGGEKTIFKPVNYQTSVTGKAVGTDHDYVTMHALNDARRKLRNYALEKYVAFEFVPNTGVLADMAEICDFSKINNNFNVTMEKTFNVYGLKPKSTLFG